MMSSEPYIVEMAVLLLLALVLGGLAGFWARRWFPPRSVANGQVEAQRASASTVPSSPIENPAPPADVAQPAAPVTVHAGQPVLLEKARDGGADDLKKINGIGPKNEKALFGLGVFHYDQIAAWEETAIAWVDEKLSFHGRIARENWVAQAKALTAAKSDA
jgi:predicted flap endonuclease-1-like 5' DNA nuclease